MEEVVMKCKMLRKVALVSILMFLLIVSTLTARVVASDSITIYGYITPRIDVTVNLAGEVFFTSNSPYASLDVMHWQELTLLSLTSL